MKKRLFSIFLAALMLLTLLPVTALAEETYYMVSVCGTDVTSANKDNIFGDGTVSYTPATGKSPAKLTLNGATLATDTTLIDASEELEIVLVGANTLTQMATNTEAIVGDDLTITGDGSLTVNDAIYAWEKLTVSGNAKVIVNKEMADDGGWPWSRDALSARDIVSIGGSSTVHVTADGCYAIQAITGIQISENANVTAVSINENKGAVRVSAGDIAITTGGKVEIKATCTDIEYKDWGRSAISAQNVTFGGSGSVTISADGSGAVSVCGETNDYGEYADGGNVTFAGSGTVTITQENSESHALYALGDVIANGSGKVSVSTTGAGAAVYAKDVNIGGSGTVEASADDGSAILAYGSCEKVTDKYLSGGDITVSGSANVTASSANGYSPAIYAAGAVTLATAGKVYAAAKNEDFGYGDAIYARNITINGKGTVTADGCINVWVGDFTVGDSADVTANYISAYQDIIITTDGNIDSGEIYTDMGDITVGGSANVTTSGISVPRGNIDIGGSADVTVTAQDGNAVYSSDITISTTGTVRLESAEAMALNCSALKVESSVGKILLYGKDMAVQVRKLDLAAGLAFYGSVEQDAAEGEMTARATHKDYFMAVGSNAAQSLVLRRTPVASILQLLSNTVATINQVRKVTRTTALLALPAVFIVNRMLTRLFR